MPVVGLPSKSHVNRAGEFLRVFDPSRIDGIDDVSDLLDALEIVSEYRQAHALPLGLVTTELAAMVRDAGSDSIVAQRLKRMPQIVRKLARHSGMKLARMQDVAGCRAVLHDRSAVDHVASAMHTRWNVARRFDYRADGKEETGYRGLHLVVESADHDGPSRAVEVQLRTASEHAWAVAIERTAARTRYELKEGRGPTVLVDYFRAASDVLSARERGADPPWSRVEALRAEAETIARASG